MAIGLTSTEFGSSAVEVEGAGVEVGCECSMVVADLSAASAKVSVEDGAQDDNTNATTMPHGLNQPVFIELHSPSLKSLQLYTRPEQFGKHRLLQTFMRTVQIQFLCCYPGMPQQLGHGVDTANRLGIEQHPGRESMPHTVRMALVLWYPRPRCQHH